MGTLLSSCACLRWCSHLCGACVHVGHAPECQLDRGRCLEKMGGLSTVTATTGPLRDVLIADDGCVPAWSVRGRCFAAMGCPLLAGLHFEKACTLQKLGIPDVLEQWVGPGARVPGSGASAGSDTTSVTLTHPGAEAAPPLPSPDPAAVVRRTGPVADGPGAGRSSGPPPRCRVDDGGHWIVRGAHAVNPNLAGRAG